MVGPSRRSRGSVGHSFPTTETTGPAGSQAPAPPKSDPARARGSRWPASSTYSFFRSPAQRSAPAVGGNLGHDRSLRGVRGVRACGGLPDPERRSAASVPRLQQRMGTPGATRAGAFPPAREPTPSAGAHPFRRTRPSVCAGRDLGSLPGRVASSEVSARRPARPQLHDPGPSREPKGDGAPALDPLGQDQRASGSTPEPASPPSR